MVNAAAAIDTGSGGFAQFARATTANAVLPSAGAVGGGEVSPGQAETPTNLLAAFRYNSFEFSYRQDFGKIVLLRQEPETGEVVQQFPTDYYLERYAQSERASRQLAQDASQAEAGKTRTAEVPAAEGEIAATATVAATSVGPAPASSSVPAAPASGGVSASPGAPALPGGGAGGGRVDITI